MKAISLLLIFFFLLFYMLTRKSIIRLIRDDKAKVEIHLQIFAFVINLEKRRQNKGKNQGRTQKEIKRRIIKTVFRAIKNSKIKLNRLTIPSCKEASASPIQMMRYRMIIASALAYIDSISSGLSFDDNAITLSPDTKAIQYDISITCYLYQIVHAAIRLGFHILKEKIKGVRE